MAKEPTDLSKLLKGISKVARNPRLTALEAARYAFGVSPTQGTHDEELARRRIGSEALDQPESGLSSIPLPDLYHQSMYTGGLSEWKGGKFDLDYQGTGEGSATEGWGAYGGEVEDTGESYRVLLEKQLADRLPLTFSEPRENITGGSPTNNLINIKVRSRAGGRKSQVEKQNDILKTLEIEVGKKWKQGLFGQGKVEDIKAEQVRETLDEILLKWETYYESRDKEWYDRTGEGLEWKGVGATALGYELRLEDINFLRSIRGKITGVGPFQTGTLHRTNLPKHIVDERFLDSDIPIDKQTPYVQKALAEIVEDRDDDELTEWFEFATADRETSRSPEYLKKINEQMKYNKLLGQKFWNIMGAGADLTWSGGNFYKALLESFQHRATDWPYGEEHPKDKQEDLYYKRQASLFLNKWGIPGLKFFDRLSRREWQRDRKKGTRNFVVWDQELLDAAPVLRVKATGGVVSKGGSTTVRNPYGYPPKAI